VLIAPLTGLFWAHGSRCRRTTPTPDHCACPVGGGLLRDRHLHWQTLVPIAVAPFGSRRWTWRSSRHIMLDTPAAA
jgi:hypothetical protein